MQPSAGTWIYSKQLNAIVVGHSDGTLKHVADLGKSDLPETEANGFVLAASKELLEAAEKYMAAVTGPLTLTCDLNAAQNELIKAISKAKGR